MNLDEHTLEGFLEWFKILILLHILGYSILRSPNLNKISDFLKHGFLIPHMMHEHTFDNFFVSGISN